MSKSAGNTIPIFAEPDEIRRLVMSMVTDPLRIKRTDPGRPEVCNVCQLHRFFGSDYLQIQDGERTARTGCVDTKQLLAERIIEHFRPMREARRRLAATLPSSRRPSRRVRRRCARSSMRRWQRCGRGGHRASGSLAHGGVDGGEGRGLGPRERRWLLLFLALGSIYFAFLAHRPGARAAGRLGDSILIILFLAWLLAFVMSSLVAWLEDRLNLPRPAIVIGSTSCTDHLRLRRLLHRGRDHPAGLRDGPQLSRHGAEIMGALADWEGGLEFGRLQIDLTDLFAGAVTESSRSPARSLIRPEHRRRHDRGARVPAADHLPLALHADGLAPDSRASPLGGAAAYRDESDLFERTTVRAFGGFLRAQLILAGCRRCWWPSSAPCSASRTSSCWDDQRAADAHPVLRPAARPRAADRRCGALRRGLSVPVAIILLVAQTLIVNWLQPRLMRAPWASTRSSCWSDAGRGAGRRLLGGAVRDPRWSPGAWVFMSYALFRTLPNAALSEAERLTDVDEHIMVSVEKEQVGDETHPKSTSRARAARTAPRRSTSRPTRWPTRTPRAPSPEGLRPGPGLGLGLDLGRGRGRRPSISSAR